MISVETVGKCFSGLGVRPGDLPEGFSLFRCEGWGGPSMSPVFILNADIGLRNLDRFLDRFPDWGDESRHSWKAAYLNLLRGEGEADQSALIEELHRKGWETRLSSHYGIWTKPLPLILPAGFSMEMAQFFAAGALMSEFWRLQRACFDCMKPSFRGELKRSLLKNPNPTTMVLLRNWERKVVAAGLVNAADGHGYLFCGCVDPAFRGRGLWKALIAARMLATMASGTRVWLFSTSNPALIGRAEHNLQVEILRQPPRGG